MNCWAFRILIVLQIAVSTGLFGASVSLTLSTNGSGSISANPSVSSYPQNSTVVLTATAAAGWQFSGWSGSIGGSVNPTNVLMDANKAITANFVAIPTYNLTVNVSGGGSVSPSGGSYLSNSTLQLTATPSNGWVFFGWSGDAGGSVNPLSLTFNTHKSVSAVFYQPVAITQHPQNIEASAGANATFSVAAAGTGPLTYSWLFNGSAIAGASGSNLALTNVQTSAAGSYQAVVTSPYGSVTSLVAMLSVSCPGTNVVSVASEVALRDAVGAGGHVRLCFNGVLALTQPIAVLKNTVLDGTGVAVSLSGNGVTRLFNVSTGVSFTVSNVALVNGRDIGTNGSDWAGSIPSTPGGVAMGGAILNIGGDVRLISCLISNNSARGGIGGSATAMQAGGSVAPTNASGGFAFGGAIYNAGGAVRLENCIVFGNRAEGGIGGTYSPVSFGQQFGPGGSAYGGAIFNVGGVVAVTGGSGMSNAAVAAAGGSAAQLASGGALYHESGTLLVSNVSLNGNLSLGLNATAIGGTPRSSPANAEAGAVAVASGQADLHYVRLAANTSTAGQAFRASFNSQARAGAVFNAGTLTVSHSTFEANETASGSGGTAPQPASGGGLFNAGTARLVAMTFVENRVRAGNGGGFGSPSGHPGGSARGGAIANVGTLSLTNVTIARNSALAGSSGGTGSAAGEAYGGGIFSEGGSAQVSFSTIASNSVIRGQLSCCGGFVAGANVAVTNGSLTLRASILAYPNTNGNVWGSAIDGGYNINSDDSLMANSGTSFNFTDPRLMPLANYGGPTPTMALATNSPAVDWVAGPAPGTDQRGVARPIGGGADAGAFELGPSASSLFVARAENSIRIQFQVRSGDSYQVQSSSDAKTWSTVDSTGVITTNGVMTRTYATFSGQQFYRLKLEL
jgi:hypothetical protein